MKKSEQKDSRRNFFKKSVALTAGLATTPFINFTQATPHNTEDSIYLIGPQEGFSPQVGTLLSTMTMMRAWVVRSVENLTQAELDFQIDDQSNSIGAMLMHLAATEKYYQLNTFEDMAWGSWSKEIKAEWDTPMGLGKKARKHIKGNDISYYLERLEAVRADTTAGFAERDDAWIMKSEPFFNNSPTNNYCKWFHVCEHESNHNGQIKFIKKRLPKK